MLKSLLKTHLHDDINNIVLDYYYNYENDKKDFIKSLNFIVNKAHDTHVYLKNNGFEYSLDMKIKSMINYSKIYVENFDFQLLPINI